MQFSRFTILLTTLASAGIMWAQQPAETVIAEEIVTVDVQSTTDDSAKAAAPTNDKVVVPPVLSLADCINIALEANPTIRVADMEIERVDYSKKEMIGQLLPSVSFGAQYNRMIAKQVAYMNMDAFPGFGGGGTTTTPGEGTGEEGELLSRAGKKDTGIKMGLDNSFSLGFSAGVPLFAPQLWLSLKLGDAQILQAVENARASRVNLVTQIKEAYYALMLAKDSRKVLQEAYDMAAFTHDIYVKQNRLGTASDFDVLRTSVAMKNLEPDIMQADIAIKRAKLQLLILMGISDKVDFDIANNLSDYEQDMYEDAMTLSRDYSDNTDLRMLEIQTRMLDNQLEVQHAAWMPTLSANFSYNWTSSSDGSPLKNFRWTPYSVFGLTLSVPLYQGGQRYSRQKQAEIQLNEMTWQRQNLENALNMQIDLSIDNINMNIKQISSNAQSMAQAKRAHEIMEKSFAIGASSYLDLRDSELALTQSRLAYYQSIYNYLIARAGLEQLLGNAPEANK